MFTAVYGSTPPSGPVPLWRMRIKVKLSLASVAALSALQGPGRNLISLILDPLLLKRILRSKCWILTNLEKYPDPYLVHGISKERFIKTF